MIGTSPSREATTTAAAEADIVAAPSSAAAKQSSAQTEKSPTTKVQKNAIAAVTNKSAVSSSSEAASSVSPSGSDAKAATTTSATKTNAAVNREIKEASATTVQAAAAAFPISTAVGAAVQASADVAQQKATKAEEKPRSATSKGKRNRRRPSYSKKKDLANRMAKGKADGSATELKVVGRAISPANLQQQANSDDVHANCKKTAATLRAKIHHWKAAVQKISKEAQAINSLSAELKLAAIISICDEAGENESNIQDRNAKRTSKRDRHRKDQDSKHRPQADNPDHRQQKLKQQQNGMMIRRPPPNQTFSGHEMLGIPYDERQDPRWPYDNVTGNRDNRGMDHRFSHLLKQNRFHAGPALNSRQQHLHVAPHHVNQQFHYYPNKDLAAQMQPLPSLSSAAESDHPVCVGIREELRRADDAESLTKLIKKAETHKIHDLAERGRRKLEKLQEQQQPQNVEQQQPSAAAVDQLGA